MQHPPVNLYIPLAFYIMVLSIHSRVFEDTCKLFKKKSPSQRDFYLFPTLSHHQSSHLRLRISYQQTSYLHVDIELKCA